VQPVSTATRPAAQVTLHADLIGNDTCIALGVSAHGQSPVLALCRALVGAGHDPDRRLEIYRGDVLCLVVRSIGVAAQLEVNSGGTGFIKPARGLRTAPSVRFGGRR
jgi:hypothetical protein